MWTGDAQVDPVDTGDAGYQLHTPAWRQAATVRPGMCREWRSENAQMKKLSGKEKNEDTEEFPPLKVWKN